MRSQSHLHCQHLYCDLTDCTTVNLLPSSADAVLNLPIDFIIKVTAKLQKTLFLTLQLELNVVLFLVMQHIFTLIIYLLLDFIQDKT